MTQPTPILPTLVGLYTFDNLKDPGLDSSGNGNNLVTSLSGVTAAVGSVTLNGGDLTTASGQAPGDFPTGNAPYTISVTFETTAPLGAEGLIGWGNYGTYGEVNALRLDSTVKLVNYWWSDDLYGPRSTPTINDGHADTVVVSYDGTTRQMYLDGTLIAQDTPPVDSHDVGTAHFAIGVTNLTEYFHGTITNVAVLDGAATPAQVAAAELSKLDTTPPTLTVVESIAGLTQATTDMLSGTVADSSGVKGVEVFDNGIDLGAATLSGSTWSFTASGLTDGTHGFSAVATDLVGNVTSPVSARASVTVDTTPPTLTATESVSGLTQATTDMISGTVADADGVKGVEVFDNGIDLGAATLSGSTWSFTASGLTDGTHGFTAIATDLAGNATGSVSAGTSVTVSSPLSTVVNLAGYNNVVVGPVAPVPASGVKGGTIVGPQSGNAAIAADGSDETVDANGWNNSITAAGDGDIINAGAGLANVTVADTNGNVTVTGALGNSRVTLGNGKETISLGGYSNAISVGAGIGSVIDAGDGNETVSIAGGTAFVTAGGHGDIFDIDGGTVTLQGMAGNAAIALGADFAPGDSVDLAGTAGDNFSFANGVLTATAADNSTYATISAAGGQSLVATPDGNGGMIVALGSAAQAAPLTPVVAPTISENTGGADLTLQSATDTVHLAGYGNVVVGGDGDHTIDGAQGNSTITLQDGNQTVTALGYNDTISVGAGNSVIVGPQGNSSVSAGNGNQTVVLFGYDNTISIGNSAAPGLSFINAGAGNETITAGNGTHFILAGGDGDTITVGNGLNLIFDSAVVMNSISGTLPDNPTGASTSLGSAHVTLGTGSNFLYLNGTGNTVTSTGGTDAIWGGAGNDTFAVGAGGGAMFIENFSLTNGDKLDLSKLSAGANPAIDLVPLPQAAGATTAFGLPEQGAMTLLTVGTGASATNIILVDTTINSVADLMAHSVIR